MKSEKGVTLTSLVVYIVVFIIILTMMSTISSFFFENVGQIKDSPKYISEFNKFSMFFVADIKRNTQLTSITQTTLEFADGTKYKYENRSIYRNEEKIAKNIESFTFNESEYMIDSFTKKIVNVNAVLGDEKEHITRNIDFVLRYW